MAVKSLKKYEGKPRDAQSGYGDNQIVFVAWDKHLIFAAPFMLCGPAGMIFAELVDSQLKQLVQLDEDAQLIDWHSVEWTKAGKPWKPDFSKSLRENGIRHKDQLRFVTPGLNTICGQ